jgi:serine phosphatase RsbU (regulator of sigma subunit)
VGGDLYDLFASEGAWSLVVGDVCGKGAQAAALTALVRYTVRTAAMHEWRTREVLLRLNEAILRQGGPASLCSVVYGRLQRTATGARATLVNAGHPPPLLVRAGGSVEVVEVPGMMLGVVPDPELSERSVELETGDSLIVYTDGVIEGGRPGRLFGEERLHRLAEQCVGLGAAEVAERIVAAAADFQNGVLRDDVAVLVLRARPAAAE